MPMTLSQFASHVNAWLAERSKGADFWLGSPEAYAWEEETREALRAFLLKLPNVLRVETDPEDPTGRTLRVSLIVWNDEGVAHEATVLILVDQAGWCVRTPDSSRCLP